MTGQLTVTVTTLTEVEGGDTQGTHSSRSVKEGQQVAVNLEKERVIIHLVKSSMTVCDSPQAARSSAKHQQEEGRAYSASARCSVASRRSRFKT